MKKNFTKKDWNKIHEAISLLFFEKLFKQKIIYLDPKELLATKDWEPNCILAVRSKEFYKVLIEFADKYCSLTTNNK